MSRQRKLTVTQEIMAQVIDTQSDREHDLSRNQYIRDAKRFVKFCRESFDSRTLEECREHIQDYSNYLQSNGYSPSTIHTYLAAVCSVFDVRLSTIQKPTRHVADYTRGRGQKRDRVNCDLEDEKWGYLVNFQRVVGIRRDELMRLKGKDFVFDESGYPCVFVARGKGGKPQLQRITGNNERFVQAYFDKVTQDELVFDRTLFRNDLNLHALRAEAARTYYFEQLQKIRQSEEYSKKLESEVRARWQACNHDKRGKVRRLPDCEIVGYYTLRGKNRELAIQKGLPLRYNKLALLATSIFKLSHWRNDVTVASYLLY